MAKQKTKSKRGVGHPSATARPFGPAELIDIERMYLQNRPWREIAAKYGVTKSAIENQINKHIRPFWRQRAENVRDEEVAKVYLLERIAWEQFEKSKQPQDSQKVEKEAVLAGADLKVVKRVLTRIVRNGEASWMSIIQWCIDWRAKIHGDYAAQKHEHAMTGDLRVAGTDANQFTQQTLAELIEAIKERKRGGDKSTTSA